MSKANEATKGVRILRSSSDGSETVDDVLAVEEPLEVRVAYRGEDGAPLSRGVSITMRTPGDDEALAVGFLATEGILGSPEDLEEITIGSGEDTSGLGLAPNIARVALQEGVDVDLEQLSRHVFTSSSCGVCGKATLEALANRGLVRLSGDEFCIASEVLRSLPGKILERQRTFAETGGLHATALVDASGKILDLAEDVGRHNALDKLVGSYLDSGISALRQQGLLLSGRASFELVQKAAVAGIPLVASIGPPSSLAIELASSHDVTLIGFLKRDRFNVYSGRVIES